MNQELINDENLVVLRKWICDIMNEADFGEDEFDLVDLCAYGSRTNGRAHADSDLDILLEYKRGYYGNFIGCENYPTCHYTRKIKK